MAGFSTADGVITIGDSSLAGVNALTTWGVEVADRPVPVTSLAQLGTADALQIWRTQPSVRKVVGFIARNVASVPWKVYQRVDDHDRQRRSRSPAEAVLRQPSRFVTSFRLLQRLTVDKCLYDRWAVVVVASPAGPVLRRIPPSRLVLDSDGFGEVERIGFVAADGGVADLTPFAVAFGTGWHSHSADGVSPLHTLHELLQEQTNAVRWRNAKWDQAPKMSGVLKRPVGAPRWKDEDRARWKLGWRAFVEGDAGGTPILEEGMEYEDLRDATKPVDAKDIEGRQLTDAEVASAYYIAPELVGARAGSFGSVAAFRQMLFGPALGPHLDEFQQAFNAEIVPALDVHRGIYGELDRWTQVNGSPLEQAKVLSTLVGAPIMTRNEGRGPLNLPQVDGGDELVTPLNVTEGGQASPQDGVTGVGGEGRGVGDDQEEQE